MQAPTFSNRIYQWAIQKASSSKAPLWLALLFLLEIFLFIPLDAVLLFFCSGNRKKIFLYALIAAFASTLSGLIGYGIGALIWDLAEPIVIPHLISPSLFEKIATHFDQYEHWAVFFASLIPFPLKALSVAAGVFDIGELSFTFYLLMARLTRFFLIGGATLLFKEKLSRFLERHFHHILFIVLIKIIAVVLFFWFLSQ